MNFPPEFQKYLRAPTTKAAFFSKIEPMHPRDCKNCGGVGTTVLFIATGGPFINVPNGKDVIAHYSGDRWWEGKNFEEMCPDCKGSGIDPNFKEPPIRMRQLDTTGVVKEVEKRDYTDI